MTTAKVIFGPEVDAAMVRLIDFVSVDEIPDVVHFLEQVQTRLVKALATFPQSGAPFQGDVRMFAVSGYTFLYEYHAPTNEVHILSMIAPGQDWR
ncbi:MAG: hypothetical protein FH759_15625 [Sediminimonas qiaohouensis]|uniref:Type II toxin-antitoxin system RelE/ParE family toxin n=1 Tax=Sediminimonas qiaohouensis TaxID=552061 RepID=A0A7C9LTQ7_9RHOB|nr:hypothetical protein [Sediminimonas qiaohouensis]MTJ06096.1 hypothetical protein [Sediminimonas qiaohouensis]